MRTTLDLDEKLMRKALAETGAKSKTEVIEMGLRSLLEREARKRLKRLYGSHPAIDEVRRRRS